MTKETYTFPQESLDPQQEGEQEALPGTRMTTPEERDVPGFERILDESTLRAHLDQANEVVLGNLRDGEHLFYDLAGELSTLEASGADTSKYKREVVEALSQLPIADIENNLDALEEEAKATDSRVLAKPAYDRVRKHITMWERMEMIGATEAQTFDEKAQDIFFGIKE